MKPIVYIDPQSIRNLAIYDYSLLSHVEGNIHYICSTFYDYLPMPAHIKQYSLFGYNNKKNNSAKAISYLWSYVRIFFLILKLRPQLIHIQWLRIPRFDVLFLRTIKKLTGSRLVFTAHNVLPHDTGNRHLPTYRNLYQTADHIIVHTYATKQEILRLFSMPEDKVSVIDHGLIQPSFDPDILKKQENEFERHYQLDNKMVFSSLGYQYYYKGVDLLAEVWATTPELNQNDKCKLLLVGKNRGVDLSTVEGIANVFVEDRLTSDEEFVYLMRHTDVYLLPYRTISQSGVLLTAIYTGTPFLATEVGGLTEPLDIAHVGWRIPQLSINTLREQLLWLLHHPEAVKTAKNNKEGWDKLRQHYDWKRIGLLTQQLYQTIL